MKSRKSMVQIDGSKKTGLNRQVEIDGSKWTGQNKWIPIDRSKKMGLKNCAKLTYLKRRVKIGGSKSKLKCHQT